MVRVEILLSKMKKILFILSIFLVFSCKEDDVITPAPVITGVEVGSQNSKIGYAGSDLHLEAQILAEGTIAKVEVSIHKESGQGWEFKKDFSEGLAGTKNGEVHTHIDIPADAALGEYHVHISVTDQQGKTTSAESELELKSDPTLPVVDEFELEVEGNELHVNAHIDAPGKVAKIELEVHGPSAKDFVWNGADEVGKDHLHFHKHVSLSGFTKGHYHVHFIVTDQAGKVREVEGEFNY